MVGKCWQDFQRNGLMWSGPQTSLQWSICIFFFFFFFLIKREEQMNLFSQVDNKMSSWWHINTFPPCGTQRLRLVGPQSHAVPCQMQEAGGSGVKVIVHHPWHTKKVEIDPILLTDNQGVLFLDSNANRKMGSWRSHRLWWHLWAYKQRSESREIH